MKKYIKLIYRISFIIICAIGIFIHLDFQDKNHTLYELSYFTVQSNIFCLIFMCVLLIKSFTGKNILTQKLLYFKGMALSSILCTFLVYHYADGKIVHYSSGNGLFGLPIESLIAHYIVPLMFLLDWLFFQPKGHFKLSFIFTWLAFPLTYLLFFFTRYLLNHPGNFDTVFKFPYFFLDFETLGINICLTYIIILAGVFVSINALVFLSDNYLFHFRKYHQ